MVFMKYYCIGIKGSGMSTLACILSDLGNQVSGYDDSRHYKFTEDLVREYWYYVVRDGGCIGCLSEYQIRNFSISFIREFDWLWKWFYIKKYHLKYFGEDFKREFWYKMEHIVVDDYIGY